MFGAGFSGSSLPLCSQPMMYPYDVPVPQPVPYPVSVPQPYLQNIAQPVDVPVPHTIQPVMIPTPVGVPVLQQVPVPYDRPCAVPVPQPVPYPVDRPCAVPFPVHVPVPQPYAVPQPVFIREQVGVPVPVPFPVPVQAPQQYQPAMQEQYYAPSSYRQVEYITERPVYMKRRCHRRRRRRCYTPTPAPLPPIIIPIPIQGATFAQEQPQLQITEYIQDIYPPAQVYTEQVPVGYMAQNSVMQQSDQIQSQQSSFNSQPGLILPPAPYVQPSSQQQQQQQQRIIQQLPSGQFIQRPLSVGGGGVQTVMLPQSGGFSPSNSAGLISNPSFGTQFIS